MPTAMRARVAQPLSVYSLSSVELLDSAWKRQLDRAVLVYSGLADDDILYGFRARSGTPSAGRPLTGWCETDSAVVFGQWLSGLARLAALTGREDLRAKAIRLMQGWADTLGPDGESPLDHYGFDKTLCGLVDIGVYLREESAWPLALRLSRWAEANLDRSNVPAVPADPALHSGLVPEWYTLSENLYRAYLFTGETEFADFARVWHYDAYWDQFAESSRPSDAWGVHAYSHLNTFSSAAAAYEVSGDKALLGVIQHAHEFFTQSQCYATGGYGPAERIQPAGGLGYSLDSRMDSFEAPCGSWAVFKLARYLQRFTGQASPGDWVERLLFNGVGAALGMEPDGRHFYYADYRPAGSVKAHNRDTFACCSGSYLQAVSDYAAQIYLESSDGININQFIPSRLRSEIGSGGVEIEVYADLPFDDRVTVHVLSSAPEPWKLRVRQPQWALTSTVEVNGAATEFDLVDGWLVIDRSWEGSTQVDVRFAREWQRVPVDHEHPSRVAVTLGPAVFVLDAWRHENTPGYPVPVGDADELGSFAVTDGHGSSFDARLRLFRDLPANWSYRMYFDAEPVALYEHHPDVELSNQ